MPVVKIRYVLRLLVDDGWRLVAMRGSHRQFEHPTKKGRVTVAGKDGARNVQLYLEASGTEGALTCAMQW